MRTLGLLFVWLGLVVSARAELVVTADFEGGSAVVESIDQATGVIRMTPAAPKDRGWACWWYGKVSGITPGQTITIDLGPNTQYRLPGGNRLSTMWATPQRAMFSVDGVTWKHTMPGKRKDDRISYAQVIDAKEAWFAWGPPFTPSDAKKFVEQIAAKSEDAKAFELCKTREDRPVPALVIHEKSDFSPRFGIWISARQHAWESGSSWVCAGLTEWLVSEDERAKSLRKQAEIVVVPIMDIDNTAIGAGGKEQLPQDHNRDWGDAPHHASVKAAQEKIVAMHKAGRFDLFLDLHNPGPRDAQPFFFVAPDELLNDVGKANLKRFVEATKTEMTGPMNLADKTRPSGASYDKNWKRISKNWVQEQTGQHVVSLTLETTWDSVHSTVEGYKAVGRQQGMAIERYFRQAPR